MHLAVETRRCCANPDHRDDGTVHFWQLGPCDEPATRALLAALDETEAGDERNEPATVALAMLRNSYAYDTLSLADYRRESANMPLTSGELASVLADEPRLGGLVTQVHRDRDGSGVYTCTVRESQITREWREVTFPDAAKKYGRIHRWSTATFRRCACGAHALQ